jgi:hypothetical protein
MSRLLLSSALVALVAGLTLLACVPIEDELLPNIGDEMRITNDPEPNYDPCWYRTYDMPSYGGSGPADLKTAQIVYHDGHTAFLYSFENKSTVELYSAPAGFEITTLDTTPCSGSLFIALYDGTEAKVIHHDSKSGAITTLYQDNGAEIESIGGTYDWYDECELLLSRADGNIYSLVIYENEQIDYDFYFEGFDVHRENGVETSYSFACDADEHTVCYIARYIEGGGYSAFEVLDNGHYNRYPMFQTCLSNADGDNDIWDFGVEVQITDKDGDEIELDSTIEYIVFNRVEDGRSDIYVVRGRDEDI